MPPSCAQMVSGTFAAISGRRGGLMVSALDFGSGGPGSSPGRGHCVVFLGKTLYSHSASLHPGVQMGTSKCAGGSRVAILLAASC